MQICKTNSSTLFEVFSLSSLLCANMFALFTLDHWEEIKCSGTMCKGQPLPPQLDVKIS